MRDLCRFISFHTLIWKQNDGISTASEFDQRISSFFFYRFQIHWDHLLIKTWFIEVKTWNLEFKLFRNEPCHPARCTLSWTVWFKLISSLLPCENIVPMNGVLVKIYSLGSWSSFRRFLFENQLWNYAFAILGSLRLLSGLLM